MAEQIKQWFLDIKDTKNCIRVGYGVRLTNFMKQLLTQTLAIEKHGKKRENNFVAVGIQIAVVFFCKALYQLAKFFTHIQMILL